MTVVVAVVVGDVDVDPKIVESQVEGEEEEADGEDVDVAIDDVHEGVV